MGSEVNDDILLVHCSLAVFELAQVTLARSRHGDFGWICPGLAKLSNHLPTKKASATRHENALILKRHGG
jgi:hypothetical protein